MLLVLMLFLCASVHVWFLDSLILFLLFLCQSKYLCFSSVCQFPHPVSPNFLGSLGGSAARRPFYERDKQDKHHATAVITCSCFGGSYP